MVITERSNDPEPPRSAKWRIDSAQDWINGVKLVAEKTQDAEAKSLLVGVLKNIAVCQIDSHKYLKLLNGAQKPTIIILPLCKVDTDLTDITRLIMEENDEDLPPSAYFSEDNPGRIYFNGETPLSKPLKGLILLHEAKHAAYFEDYRLKNAQKIDDWREETLAFEFELRLLEKLVGKTYSNYLHALTEQFISNYDDHDGQGGMLPGPELVHANILDAVFGQSLSKRETEIRRSIIWTHAIFSMFELKYPASVNTDKDSFMQEISSLQGTNDS